MRIYSVLQIKNKDPTKTDFTGYNNKELLKNSEIKIFSRDIQIKNKEIWKLFARCNPPEMKLVLCEVKTDMNCLPLYSTHKLNVLFYFLRIK